MTIILASASPRRRRLLEEAGIPFNVCPADIDETLLNGETVEAHVQRLARLKACKVSSRFPDRVVLGADTVVVMDGRVYGKPEGPEEARTFLRGFSGRTHQVLTGTCLTRQTPPREKTWVSRSLVRFKSLTDHDIETYCRKVNTLDKAGAYGIQEHGDLIVETVQGLVSNVIGLPIEEVVEELDSFH